MVSKENSLVRCVILAACTLNGSPDVISFAVGYDIVICVCVLIRHFDICFNKHIYIYIYIYIYIFNFGLSC